jgi:hypothetical protein
VLHELRERTIPLSNVTDDFLLFFQNAYLLRVLLKFDKNSIVFFVPSRVTGRTMDVDRSFISVRTGMVCKLPRDLPHLIETDGRRWQPITTTITIESDGMPSGRNRSPASIESCSPRLHPERARNSLRKKIRRIFEKKAQVVTCCRP